MLAANRSPNPLPFLPIPIQFPFKRRQSDGATVHQAASLENTDS